MSLRAQKNSNKQKSQMSFSCGSFGVLFLLCMFATNCQYNVHEACQLMDMCVFVNTERNAIVSLWFFFVPPLFFYLVAHCFICFFSLLLPLFVHNLCALLSFHHSYLPPPPFATAFGASFPSSPPTPPSTCPGAGVRKLVDCPQLLDVDDMVKMREPDWKCVYTYLQEFYRGLVTKGLVKTKNSS